MSSIVNIGKSIRYRDLFYDFFICNILFDGCIADFFTFFIVIRRYAYFYPEVSSVFFAIFKLSIVNFIFRYGLPEVVMKLFFCILMFHDIVILPQQLIFCIAACFNKSVTYKGDFPIQIRT